MERRTYGQLSLKERIEIYRLHEDGKSARLIAEILGRSNATVSRELRRNGKGGYEPQRAQARSGKRHARGRAHKLERQPELRKTVRDLLAMERSPEQIAGRLTGRDGKPLISHESIYRYIYWHSYHFRDEEWHRLLPSGRRRRQRRAGRRRGGEKAPIPNKTPLSCRPAGAANRSRYGHWESDLMQFSSGRKALLVLHDRRSRYVCLRWVREKTAREVVRGLHEAFDSLPANRRKSVTFDNGQEFRRHEELARHKGIKTFFCEPRSPWQKGGVENTNRRLRRFLPRKTDQSALSQEHLADIMEKMNNTPRKCLGFKTPKEAIFNQRVALQT